MKPITRTRITGLLASAAALAVSAGALPSAPAEAQEAQRAPAPTVLARHLLAPLSLAVGRAGVFLAEPVPTDVEVGPQGRLYVTTLAGEFPDAGGIFRINPANGKTTEVFHGLFAATGLALAPNGDMYVAMLFPGVILRIPAGGGAPQPFASVNQPAALEISDDYLYATVNVLSGLGFKKRQAQFAPRGQELRAGPNGKLVRWKL